MEYEIEMQNISTSYLRIHNISAHIPCWPHLSSRSGPQKPQQLYSNLRLHMQAGSYGNLASSEWMPQVLWKVPYWARLNIKTVFPWYGDSHVKDKMVSETVLSLTWGSLYW